MSTAITNEDAAILAKQFFTSNDPVIINFKLKPFSSEKLGYLGVHQLLTIEAREQDGDPETTKKVLKFFVKSIMPNNNEFDRLIYREENKFFGEVVPQLIDQCQFKPWSAKCYLVKEGLMVLEDLKSKGFKITTGVLGNNHLRSACKTLARFHASSMLLERKLQKPLNEVYKGFFHEKVFVNDGGLAWRWLVTGIEVVEAIAEKLSLDPSKVLKAYKLLLSKMSLVNNKRNVLCHGDLWSNNMMFNDDGTECRLVDFQMVAYKSFALDLTLLLYLNTAVESRQSLEKEIIELYHSVLAEKLSSNGYKNDEIISLEEVLQGFENKRICGVVASVQFFPIALLNNELSNEYTKDPELLDQYMYTSRKDFVFKAMQRDDNYRQRVEACVTDLAKFMDNCVEDIKVEIV